MLARPWRMSRVRASTPAGHLRQVLGPIAAGGSWSLSPAAGMVRGMGIDREAFDALYPLAERPLQPLQKLAVEVIRQAHQDLQAPDPLVQRDAQRFFAGPAFPVWASFTSLSVPAVRRRLVILRLVDADDDGA